MAEKPKLCKAVTKIMGGACSSCAGKGQRMKAREPPSVNAWGHVTTPFPLKFHMSTPYLMPYNAM